MKQKIALLPKERDNYLCWDLAEELNDENGDTHFIKWGVPFLGFKYLIWNMMIMKMPALSGCYEKQVR